MKYLIFFFHSFFKYFLTKKYSKIFFSSIDEVLVKAFYLFLVDELLTFCAKTVCLILKVAVKIASTTHSFIHSYCPSSSQSTQKMLTNWEPFSHSSSLWSFLFEQIHWHKRHLIRRCNGIIRVGCSFLINDAKRIKYNSNNFVGTFHLKCCWNLKKRFKVFYMEEEWF